MARAAAAAPGMVYGLFDPESTGDCTDEQLLSQFVTQSDEMAQAAFAIVVERYSPIVHHVCWNVLVMQTRCRGRGPGRFPCPGRQAQSIRKPHSLGPWLHGVAVRVARRAKTAAGRRRVAEQRKAEMVHEIDGIEWGLTRPSIASSMKRSIGFLKNIACRSFSATCKDS